MNQQEPRLDLIFAPASVYIDSNFHGGPPWSYEPATLSFQQDTQTAGPNSFSHKDCYIYDYAGALSIGKTLDSGHLEGCDSPAQFLGEPAGKEPTWPASALRGGLFQALAGNGKCSGRAPLQPLLVLSGE